MSQEFRVAGRFMYEYYWIGIHTHFIFIGSDVIVLYFIDISDRDELNFLFRSQLVNFELN